MNAIETPPIERPVVPAGDATIPTGLIQLLPATFPASSGCYTEGGGVGLLVRCAGPEREGRLDLEVRLLPLRLQGAVGVPEEPADDAVMAYLQNELARSEARLRAAACQAIGRLGDPSAMPALLQVASEDPDPFVQQVAQAALVNLEAPVVSRAMLTGVALHLDSALQCGARVSLGPLETDSRGSVVFRGVPHDANCRLRLAAAPVPPDSVVPNLVKLLDKLEFGHGQPTRERGDGCAVEITPYDIGEPRRFGALFRFTPPLCIERGERLPALAVRHGAEFWAPTFVQPAIGLAWFNRLPFGRFVTHALGDREKAHTGPSRVLLARHSISFFDEVARATEAGSQILHPSDSRLVAMIECGRQHEVVLTVQTHAPELQDALVRFELGGERGELAFTGRADKPLWRATAHLRQPYVGDEAIRIAVRLAPGSY